MIRTLTAVGATLGLLATTSLARAQALELGHRGEFVLSADRLVPLISYSRVAQDELPPLPNGTVSASTRTSQTAMSFFWGSTSPEQTFFTVPRVGFDYVVVPNVTVGGDLIVAFTLGSHQSTETQRASGVTTTTSNGNGGMWAFGIAPRAGYVLRLTNLLSLWLRGGLSFYTMTTSSPKDPNGAYTHTNVDQFALDLEPQLVITPVPHFGITAGVNADIPIAGAHSLTAYDGTGGSVEQSASSSILFVGATLGLLGYF